MRYRLSNVIVTGLGVEGTAGDGMPAETVSFDYSKIQWTHTDVNDAGTAIGSTAASWDLVVRKGAQQAADGDLSEPVPAAAESAGLGTQVVADPGADALLAASWLVRSLSKIEGIPGESTDDKHKGWIDVTSYCHSVAQTVNWTDPGDRTAGHSQHADFAFAKLLDKASPKLALYCCNGRVISSVTLELCRDDAAGRRFMQYKLTDVLVTGVAVEGDVAQPRPAETVTLDYGKIEWTYTPIDPDTGTAGTNITTSWDLMTNKGAQQAEPGDVSEPVIVAAPQQAAQRAPAPIRPATLGGRSLRRVLPQDRQHPRRVDRRQPQGLDRDHLVQPCDHPTRHDLHERTHRGPLAARRLQRGQADRQGLAQAFCLLLQRPVDPLGDHRAVPGRPHGAAIHAVQAHRRARRGDPRGRQAGGRPCAGGRAFDYRTIEWTYTELDPDTGKPEGDVRANWNLVEDRGALRPLRCGRRV